MEIFWILAVQNLNVPEKYGGQQLLFFEDFPDSLNAELEMTSYDYPPSALALKQVLFALMQRFKCGLIANRDWGII